jgi:hypothetical protein
LLQRDITKNREKRYSSPIVEEKGIKTEIPTRNSTLVERINYRGTRVETLLNLIG